MQHNERELNMVKKLDIISSTGFTTDSAAYIQTNEDLRYAMRFMPKDCNRALTVAASGDHPLWCSLYGAKHVDTFDITFNAKCIMDIKVVALNCLNRDEYMALLKDLSHWPYAKQSLFWPKIAKQLPWDDLKYICLNRKKELFDRGGRGNIDIYRLPTAQEHEKLQKIVKNPYNFFQADIGGLKYELIESYDFIHLSNIFEHIKLTLNQKENIITTLMGRVNVGGRILFQHLIYAPWKRPPVPELLCSTHGDTDWRFVQIDMISFLERIR